MGSDSEADLVVTALARSNRRADYRFRLHRAALRPADRARARAGGEARRVPAARIGFFVALVGLATWPLLILFRLSAPDSAGFYVGMVASVFLLTFPYGAMVSLVLEQAPRSIQSTATAFTMFVANVLVIGTGTYAIGFFGDLLEAQQITAPLTKALLGADVVVLLAIALYFRLHWSIRLRSSDMARASPRSTIST